MTHEYLSKETYEFAGSILPKTFDNEPRELVPIHKYKILQK